MFKTLRKGTPITFSLSHRERSDSDWVSIAMK